MLYEQFNIEFSECKNFVIEVLEHSRALQDSKLSGLENTMKYIHL